MNKQSPQKFFSSGEAVRTVIVHSIFETIQGEGPFTGTPCVFVRLTGCNLQCPKCDTEYTDKANELELFQVVQKVKQLRKGGLVVITGGEPFRQNHAMNLAEELLEAGFYVQFETNGTLFPLPKGASVAHYTYLINRKPDERKGIYLVCSPKTGSVNMLVQSYVCAYKYVGGALDLMEDGLPKTALDHTAKPHLFRKPAKHNIPVYLQPLDDHDPVLNENNLKACIASCLKHGYILQLQTHKIINVE